MEKIENAPRNEAQDDVIVLGIASVETQGSPGPTNEPVGYRALPEIAEE